MIAAEVYLLALTAALYVLRGMLELPAVGWRTEVKATAAIGVIVLPALAGLAASPMSFGPLVIASLSVVGFAINAVLLVRLWQGLTPVAVLTMLIITAYASIVALTL
jgi:hypothetical protein